MEKVNILLVDDDPTNLLSIEAMLNPLGENLVCVSSAEEALRSVLEMDFAVILLDIRLQGMSGLEAASLIREREKSHATPIIFITAFSSDSQEIMRAYSVGAIDYLSKPVIPDV